MFFIFFLDIVALPEFQYGAMENWGLITYRETEIFSNTGDNDTFISAHQWFITTVAHELAHQVLQKFIYLIVNT